MKVTSENSKNVFKNLYGVENQIDLLKRSSTQKIPTGSTVREKYELKPFHKSFYPNWTDQIYTIKGVSDLGIKRFYLLKAENGRDEPRRYYREDSQTVKVDLHRIETVINRRVYKGREQLLVKLLGYRDSYKSWVNENAIKRLK